jgi:hypothetical protein
LSKDLQEDKPKGKSAYAATNMDPHETLYLETNEDGTVSIKYYQYKEVINWSEFATKLHSIEDALNTEGYYIQGRPVKDGYNPTVEGELKETAKGETQLLAKGKDIDAVTKKFNAKKKELGK